MRLDKIAGLRHSRDTSNANGSTGSAESFHRHWQASYGSIPKEINPNKYPSVTAMCEEAMGRYANLTAIYSQGQGLRYQQIDDLSRALAAYFQNVLGIQKSNRVAVIAPNIAAVPISIIGAMRCGAVLVSINPAQNSTAIEKQLIDAGVDLVVVYDKYGHSIQRAIAQADVRHVIVAGKNDPFHGNETAVLSNTKPKNATPFSECLAAGASLPFQHIPVEGDDLLFLDYSANSVAKGVMLSHRNVVANAEQFKHFMPSCVLPSKEVIVSVMGLHQRFSLMLAIIYFSIGSENHLQMESDSVDQLLDTLAAAQPTIFPAVVPLFEHLVDHPRIGLIDWSALKLSMSLDTDMSAEQSSIWQQLTGSFIHEGYGLPASSPVLSLSPMGIRSPAASKGLPLPSTDIKLIDKDGHAVGLGEAGEICAKGPQVLQGYWKQPKETQAAFTPDGYFRTGDVGIFHSNGCLEILERQPLLEAFTQPRQNKACA